MKLNDYADNIEQAVLGTIAEGKVSVISAFEDHTLIRYR